MKSTIHNHELPSSPQNTKSLNLYIDLLMRRRLVWSRARMRLLSTPASGVARSESCWIYSARRG